MHDVVMYRSPHDYTCASINGGDSNGNSTRTRPVKHLTLANPLLPNFDGGSRRTLCHACHNLGRWRRNAETGPARCVIGLCSSQMETVLPFDGA